MASIGAHRDATGSRTNGHTVIACAVCDHPWAEHDMIAARYCTATVVGHHDRGCICVERSGPGKDDGTARAD